MAFLSLHAQAASNAFASHIDSIEAIAHLIPKVAAVFTIITLIALLFSIFMDVPSQAARRLIPCLVLFSAITGASLAIDRMGVLEGITDPASFADLIANSTSVLMVLVVGAIALRAAYCLLRNSDAARYAHAIAVERQAIESANERIEQLLTSLAQIRESHGDACIGSSKVSIERLQAAHLALGRIREDTRQDSPLDSETREQFNAIVRMLNSCMPLLEEHLQAHRRSTGEAWRVTHLRPGQRHFAESRAHGSNMPMPELHDIGEPNPALDLAGLICTWLDGDRDERSRVCGIAPPGQSRRPASDDSNATETDWYTGFNDTGSNECGGGSDYSSGSYSDPD